MGFGLAGMVSLLLSGNGGEGGALAGNAGRRCGAPRQARILTD